MNVRTFLPALSLALLAFTPVLETANRLFIDDQELPSGRTDLEAFVKCDNDVKLYAVSVAIAFDPTLIQVKRVELAGVAADAEWEAGNDLARYGGLFGLTALLTAAGFFTGIRLGETKIK